MKRIRLIKIPILLTLLLGLPMATYAKAKIPVGTREVIKVVYEIPKKDSIEVDGKLLDLARFHKEFNIAYILPLWVEEEPKLVLYDAKSETYYETDTPKARTFIKEYLKAKNLDEADLLQLPFYTRYGGKIVVLLIIGLMIWGAIPSRKDDTIQPTKL